MTLVQLQAAWKMLLEAQEKIGNGNMVGEDPVELVKAHLLPEEAESFIEWISEEKMGYMRSVRLLQKSDRRYQGGRLPERPGAEEPIRRAGFLQENYEG